MTTVPAADAGGEPGDDGARRPTGDHDACAACGAPTAARPGGTQRVGGRTVRRELGSCRRCGLQLVRFEGEGGWREIRG